QQPVVTVERLELRHPAVWIVDVAEDDRVGRTGLLAGSLQRAVFDFELAILANRRDFSVNAVLGDALHAVGALFHDAAAAHADVGIAHQLVLRSLPVLEQQKVEAAHLVRTVVRAIARADAAVVDLVVQAFAAMDGRAHRTYQFAGRILALHARHRLEMGPGGVAVSLIVGIDPNPVHVAAFHHLLFADHGDVVLRLAGDDAVIATHAGVQLNGHSPGVGRLLIVIA